MRRPGPVRDRPARGAHLIVALLLALVLASCTGGGSEPRSGGAPEPSPGEVAEARTTLDATDLTDEASVDRVEGLRYTDAGAQAAREALEAGVTGDELWGATWVYASSGTDPAPLVPLLEHEDPSIRLMAAAGLVWLGDVRGFDTLVALVVVDDLVAGSHPPVPMWRYTGTTLRELTGQDLGPAYDATPKEAAAAAVAWADWLEANRANLRFDATTGTWSVG